MGGGKKRLGPASRISWFSWPGSLALAPFSASMISGMFCAAAWPALKVSPASTAEAAVMNFRRPNSFPIPFEPELDVSSLSVRCFTNCDLAGVVIPGQQTRCFRPARRSYQVSLDADNNRNRQQKRQSRPRKCDRLRRVWLLRLRWLQRYSFFRVSNPAECSPAVYAQAPAHFHRERK